MNKNPAKSNHPSKHSKQMNLPFSLRLTRAINGFFKFVFGTALFLLLYLMFNSIIEIYDMTILQQISFFMLLSVLSTMIALIMSYMFLFLFLRSMRKSYRTLHELNSSLFVMDAMIYDMISIILDSILLAVGILVFIDHFAATYDAFLLIYLLIKLMGRILAFLITKASAFSFFAKMVIIVTFVGLLLISIFEFYPYLHTLLFEAS